MTGKPAPPLAGRLALQLSSGRSASISDLEGKRGASHREGPGVSERRGNRLQGESGVAPGCPAWRTFCDRKGTRCNAVCCYSDLGE